MYLESKRHWVHSASVDVILILVVHEERCVPGVARTTGGVAGTLVSIHQTRRHPHIQDTPLIQHLTEHHVCVDIDYKHPKYIEDHPNHRIEVQEICQKQTYHQIAKGRLCIVFLYFSKVFNILYQI